ncbi:MAG: circularly permuted type 2 ATP-grasp protein, partial [Rhodobacteraceae bacterium]|nr:circularly permuted type 2 ATP-grasp protein [Paracoccaceae bacterium]
MLQDRGAAQLLRDYRPASGVSDELLAPDGSVRPVWRKFVNHLARLSPDEVEARFSRGDRYLRDAGVFYRKYETAGPAERDWPLSHIPVMIHDDDWAEIRTGLIQRAELLEDVARDLYGDNKLVAGGYLPPSLIAQNPAWLRPLVGTKPLGGHFLNFVAFEIGRGPDGHWWVLGDRTEAPSGAGFALENRVASSRIFPNFYAKTDVHRLAGFFRAFQAALEADQDPRDGRIAILTPGPLNDVYFEHTYIARHLGLLLAEGEDLTVRKGKVMVRTVDGLKPVSVLWRRLDGISCDPIELDPESRLGTPGLVDAIRRGGVRMVNALGTGILETRALMSFLPKISEVLNDEPLDLPNIATWWCGQSRERAHVLENADRMMIGSAYSTRLPFDSDDRMTLGRTLEATGRARLERLLVEKGRDLVGQEAVTLSTTPVWHEGRLVPRPMVLRVFLARTPSGWQTMPGGYARIGSGPDTAALAMQAGGTVADVWVVSDHPVSRKGMVGQRPSETRRQDIDALPSRAADNLFW